MRQRAIWGGAVAAMLLASSALATYVRMTPPAEQWRAIAWPFPRDGWPAGRAYRCPAAACGEQMELYVRPKIGFCNCDSGVADDDEVDRVADLDLIDPQFRPLQSGSLVQIADMKGRARAYHLGPGDGAGRRAVGMAVSRRCDLMVAVVQGSAAEDDLKARALRFLASADAERWIRSAMQGG